MQLLYAFVVIVAFAGGIQVHLQCIDGKGLIVEANIRKSYRYAHFTIRKKKQANRQALA